MECVSFRALLRIDIVSSGNSASLRLSGRLAGEEVAVLEQQISHRGVPGKIDLGELVFADEAGIEALLRLKERGAMFHGVPPFIELLLRSGAAPSEAGRNG